VAFPSACLCGQRIVGDESSLDSFAGGLDDEGVDPSVRRSKNIYDFTAVFLRIDPRSVYSGQLVQYMGIDDKQSYVPVLAIASKRAREKGHRIAAIASLLTDRWMRLLA